MSGTHAQRNKYGEHSTIGDPSVRPTPTQGSPTEYRFGHEREVALLDYPVCVLEGFTPDRR